MKSKASERYFGLIRTLFATHGRGLSEGMFEAFQEELLLIFTQDVSKVLPDVNHELSCAFIKQVKEMLQENATDYPQSVLVMPAGGFAQWLGKKIENDKLKVEAFLDNYMEEGGTVEGIPIFKPEKVKGISFDKIVLATPSYSAQVSMYDQLEQLLGNSDNILMAADVSLALKLSDIDDNTEKKAERVAELINGLRPEKDCMKILFAVPSFPAHYVGTIRALRRSGHKVVLLSNNPDIMYGPKVSEYSHEFDLIHTTENNLLEFLKIIQKCEADVLYAVDYSLFNYLALLIRDLWQGRMLLEVYDFSDNVQYEKGEGLKSAEKNIGLDMQVLENHARKILYSKVDGIIYRDSPKLLERARKIYGMEAKAIRFLPYPERYNKLKDLDGCEHIVFSGHILNVKEELVYTVMELARELSSQGMHTHFYNPADPNGNILKEFIDLAESDQFIHYHKPIPLEDLNYIMRKYNWGWLAYDFTNMPSQVMVQNEHTFASRILSYISAGLPIICSEENTYQANIIKKHGVGIIVKRHDIPCLTEILSKVDYEDMCGNVQRLKKDWDINTRISDLVEFMRGKDVENI